MLIEFVFRRLPLAAAAIVGAARRAQNKPSRCSTSRTIRRASCTRTSTPPSRSAWKAKTGQAVTINQSHGGSGKQARAVIDGLEADVVTLALAYDIDALEQHGKLMPADWQKRLPNNSDAVHVDDRVPGPQGQPEEHQGLGRPGAARRLGHHAEPEDVGRRALELSGGLGLRAEAIAAATRRRRRSSSRKLYKNVPVLDSGARGSTTTFVAARHRRRADRVGERGAAGDSRSSGQDKFEIVVPSVEHPRRAAGGGRRQGRRQARHAEGRPGVSRVPVLARRAGDRGEALLPPAPEADVLAKYAAQFPKVTLFTIDEVFGGWTKAQKTHFADGGVFDQIYQPGIVGTTRGSTLTVARAAHVLPGLRPGARASRSLYLSACSC